MPVNIQCCSRKHRTCTLKQRGYTRIKWRRQPGTKILLLHSQVGQNPGSALHDCAAKPAELLSESAFSRIVITSRANHVAPAHVQAANEPHEKMDSRDPGERDEKRRLHIPVDFTEKYWPHPLRPAVCMHHALFTCFRKKQ